MSSNILIPKILLQTSPKKQPQYVIDMINEKAPDYNYQHYTDEEIIQFFINNPLDEFPNIIERFNTMPGGAYKADIFRYYFLYIKGGVFLDSDAMIEVPLDSLINSVDFFTIENKATRLMFQGFIGCTPGHPIIYEALKDIYTTTNEQISLKRDFHQFCKNLFQIIHSFNDSKYNIRLFQEHGTTSYDENNKLILTHHCYTKTIPRK